MNWDEIVKKVTPHVVKIETPGGHGTGFVCFVNEARAFWGIATANHVVDDADQWQQPIRIQHTNGKVAFLKEDQRIILPDSNLDSAVILVPIAQLDFPEPLIQLRPIGDRLPVGVEVGWLGYPAVTRTLCFFSGNISAFDESRHAYLIDGVAINGVSGGPVIYSHDGSDIHVVGSITAYMANRQTGATLPGLSVAQDVSHFHDVTGNIRSYDEAKRKKAEEEAKQKAEAEKRATEQPQPTSPIQPSEAAAPQTT